MPKILWQNDLTIFKLIRTKEDPGKSGSFVTVFPMCEAVPLPMWKNRHPHHFIKTHKLSLKTNQFGTLAIRMEARHKPEWYEW